LVTHSTQLNQVKIGNDLESYHFPFFSVNELVILISASSYGMMGQNAAIGAFIHDQTAPNLQKR
jgi:hypothetical protein